MKGCRVEEKVLGETGAMGFLQPTGPLLRKQERKNSKKLL